ncbi:hypothetical protein JYU34_005672 [Plutella xylostella]|uniref:Uncharacterized protein n=1 Tax=Plutella xylostella TaxID=51655 RepID=A0ABQ7QTU6_PLUXY|nr:hypothetical protein JYU34_005672 [Plutella xylostella]
MPKRSSKYAIQFVWNDRCLAVTRLLIKIARWLPRRDCSRLQCGLRGRTPLAMSSPT